MKKFGKITAFLVVLMLCLGMLNISVLAATTSQDELEVTFTTDKDTYSQGEQIKVALGVKNTGTITFENVVIESIVPNGYKLSESMTATKTIALLEAGKSEAFEVVFVESTNSEAETPVVPPTVPDSEVEVPTPPSVVPNENKEPNKESSVPDTSDKSDIGILIVLMSGSAIVIATLLVIKTKEGKRILSMFLCITMVLTLFPDVSALAETKKMEDKELTVEHTITIVGEQVTLKATVKYQMPEKEKVENCVNIDKSNFVYDEINKYYYVSDKLESLKGTCTDTTDASAGTWKVSDITGNILGSGTFVPQAEWTIDGIGLILGENIVEVSIQHKDGKSCVEKIVLLNICEENMSSVDIDMEDPDADGIPNYLEVRYGTDKNKEDTDGDALSDYVEIANLGTNPLQKDSDVDGVLDGDEDSDNDTLTNLKELELGTSLTNIDTDGDTLNDAEDVTYKTNPLKEDTDGDGMTDAFEIANGYDPLTVNDLTAEVSKNYTASDFNIEGEVVSASIDLTASLGEQLSFNMEVADNELLDESMAGWIGAAYDFTMSGEFEEAVVTFTYDDTLVPQALSEDEFIPAIYYFNEETQMLEEVPNQTIDGNSVSAKLEHFSIYVLLNKVEFESAWNEDIKAPGTENEVAKDLNIAFTIDVSGSMSGTKISTVKTVMESFISNLGEKDYASIVKFASSAKLVQGLTNNKEALYNATQLLYASGGTSIRNGVALSLEHLLQGRDNVNDNTYDVIILLTDGEDSSFNRYWNEYAQTCKENGIIAYSIGIGSSVSSSHLTQFAEETGGKYYHAEVVSDLQDQFEEIKGETVDYVTDSNNDGITDYYTKLICDGTLKTTTGGLVFAGASYEEIQANADFDKDGLKNGDEIKVVSVGDNVYVKVYSYPDYEYSDADVYTDYEEKTNGTNPLVSNAIFYQEDIDYLTEDDNFVSEKYREVYESAILGDFEKISIWIGNNVFGSNHDQVYTYKCFLMSYFNALYDSQLKKKEIEEKVSNILDLIANMKDSTENAIKIVGGTPEVIKEKKEILTALKKELEAASKEVARLRNEGYDSAIMEKDEFYKIFDNAYDRYRDANEKIPELKKEIEFKSKLKKVGDVTEKVGIVLDFISLGMDVYSAWDSYATFAANMNMISENVEVLDIIKENTTDDNLKSACNELREALKEESELNAQKWQDMLDAAGCKGYRMAIAAFGAKIPVIGKYVVAVVAAVGVVDFLTNISDVAKQCTGVYALSSAASYMASDYDSMMNKYTNGSNSNGKYKIVYTNYSDASDMYCNLAVLRQVAEEQMQNANKANAWYIEWLFTKIIYKESNISENVEKLKKEAFVYKYIGQM